ncbi:MAG: sulfurtransferase, partial [Hyphomicrobiaceae bacterium]
CSTGHWASLGWFVSSEILGNKDAKMYPGSMAEWTADAGRPVEQKVK